jgi:hypothetical protein
MECSHFLAAASQRLGAAEQLRQCCHAVGIAATTAAVAASAAKELP